MLRTTTLAPFRSSALVVLLTTLVPALSAQRVVHELDGAWEVRRLDRDDAAWRPIEIPSTFESVLGTDFDGVAEYRRTVRVADLDSRPGDRLELRFGAVATHAVVSVNGAVLGEHLGGWTPFRFALPQELLDDETWTVRVRVDERVGHNTQGFLPIIAPHFGGIWQGVQLTRHRGPTLEPDQVVVRTGWRDGRGELSVDPGPLPDGYAIRCTLTAGSERPLGEDLTVPGDVEPWTPQAPNRYPLRIELVDPTGTVADRIERHVVFTEVAAEGRRILVDGEPFRVRGVLHWGYEPPSLAPHSDVARWRRQFRQLKSWGFDLVKACLWFPPPAFFDAAEIEGLFVWQEYPAWHPDFSKEHLDELLREYDEFFAIDRQRAIVLARSLTCETGRSADADVVEALFRRCKQATGAALVEDDSSWIDWNRFHDFYDDHPYGNCGPWLERLRGFDRYIDEHGDKPFLLGEAITSDTWIADDVFADEMLRAAWWRPFALDEQAAFERRVRERMGAAAADALVPDSLRYAMLARKYQIETFCRVFPYAGYVVSVMRDFRKARMGLVDDLGRPKWTTDDFAWHGEGMLVLDDPRAIRSVRSVEQLPPALFGDPAVVWRVESEPFEGGARVRASGPAPADAVQRVRVHAGGDRPSTWTFYRCPEVGSEVPEGVRIASRFDAQLLAWVEDGGRLLLVPGGAGALRSEALWFLRGAPYGPLDHPLLRRVPRELLVDLQPFDFDGPVFSDTPLLARMDTILGFWDTHDRTEDVGTYAFLAEARVGRGRILACALGLALDPEPPFGASEDERAPAAANPARAWLRAELLRHLAQGPAPRALVDGAALAAIRRQLRGEHVALDGVWLLRADPDDVGAQQGWAAAEHAEDDWLRSRAGVHWESAGLPHHDGIAWYRRTFEAPAFWHAEEPLYAVFDGVDDSYTLYVNGERVGSFGDPATGETVWLVRTHADVSRFLRAGTNVLALRVVDHQGAGGLHRGVRLTTASPDLEDVLNR